MAGMHRTLYCYAEGKGREWEAICLDLDIAVQGHSFAEVYQSLNEAIDVYLESVEALPEAEQARLLSRKAPLRVRVKFFWFAFKSLFSGGDDDNQHAEFTLAAPA